MRHAYWFLSMPLPNIIKIFQTINKLWHTQEFGLEIHSGKITRKKNHSRCCPSSMQHFFLTRYMSLPNIIKLSQAVWELWPAQDFSFRGCKYIMKWELSLLQVTCLLVLLLFIPTKYYQNTSKGIKVMECTRMPLRTNGPTDGGLAGRYILPTEQLDRGTSG